MSQARYHINVLTAGFTSPNGRAFLMPLVLHRRALSDAGFDIRITTKMSASLTDCDALIVDGRYFSARWATDSDTILEELTRLRAKVRHLIYISLADSAGWDHARPLAYVSLYCKSQLYRDRSVYLRPLYGHRLYSDYYHRNFGIEDEQPVYSEPVKDPALLKKLAVSWNSGLADYSWLGPLRMQLYNFLPIQSLLEFPNTYHSASAQRNKAFSCRIGTRYLRETIAFQRKRIAGILASHIETVKLSRWSYLNELRNSRIAISPFGLGEITLRDFEIHMAGTLLLKPDMASIETWPDFFRDGDTMLAFRWDFSDLQEKLEMALANQARTIEIAAAGLAGYRRHLIGPEAARLFIEHFALMLAKSERVGAQT